MAMPFGRGKQIERALLGLDSFPEGYTGSRTVSELTALFDACFRIQREACEAAGKHIPMVVENVRGAQKWVGRARWNFGSFYLWGDVPALMPMIVKAQKGRSNFHFYEKTGLPSPSFHGAAHEPSVMRHEAIKNTGVKVATMGAGWYPPGHPKHVPGLGFNTHTERAIKNNGGHDGVKQHKSGRAWFNDPDSISGSTSSKSSARKAASAMIAKIPLALSRHIARTWR